ncbi:MAG: YbaN family protein, partial [Arenibacterium sp.]
PRLRAWLLRHPRFGPAILDWEATGAIPRRVKYLACSVMALTWAVCFAIGLAWHILLAQALLMGVGAAYVLSRPDR